MGLTNLHVCRTSISAETRTDVCARNPFISSGVYRLRSFLNIEGKSSTDVGVRAWLAEQELVLNNMDMMPVSQYVRTVYCREYCSRMARILENAEISLPAAPGRSKFKIWHPHKELKSQVYEHLLM